MGGVPYIYINQGNSSAMQYGHIHTSGIVVESMESSMTFAALEEISVENLESVNEALGQGSEAFKTQPPYC